MRAAASGVITMIAAASALAPSRAVAGTESACSGPDGVTVVVDFADDRGDGVTRCVPEGGGYADDLFAAAQVDLEYVQRQPGFVCRVDGHPADQTCLATPPATAYWALWWSPPGDPKWRYATSSVGSQEVPAGGRVALAWQHGSERRPPAATLPASRTGPSPDPADADRDREADGDDDRDDDGVPVWVAPVVIVLLFGAGGTVAVVRRRGRTP